MLLIVADTRSNRAFLELHREQLRGLLPLDSRQVLDAFRRACSPRRAASSSSERTGYAPRMQRYDSTTALIVVDVQNDFADPAGGLAVAGGERIGPRINTEIEMAREAGASIFYTQDWHPESTPHFAKDGGIWPVHCVADTWGASSIRTSSSTGRSFARGPTARMATRASRCATRQGRNEADRARGPRPGPQRHAPLRVRPRHRLLRQRDGNRRAATRVQTSVLAHLCMPVNLRAGDDKRAIEQMQSAGVDVVGPSS